MKTATIAIGLCIVAGRVQAATISHDFSGGGFGKHGNDFTIAGFDTSLGTLQEIIIDTSGSASFDAGLGRYSTDPVSYTATSSQGLYFTSFDSFGPGEGLAGSGTVDPIDGTHFTAAASGTGGHGDYTDAGFLAHFLDADVSAYFQTDEPTIYFTQGSNGSQLATDTAYDMVAGTGTITYVYATAGAVPEPATWATMAGGFGLLGGALRRACRPAAVPG